MTNGPENSFKEASPRHTKSTNVETKIFLRSEQQTDRSALLSTNSTKQTYIRHVGDVEVGRRGAAADEAPGPEAAAQAQPLPGLGAARAQVEHVAPDAKAVHDVYGGGFRFAVSPNYE